MPDISDFHMCAHRLTNMYIHVEMYTLQHIITQTYTHDDKKINTGKQLLDGLPFTVL